MRLIIAAVGKLKDAEERGICERYAKRLAVTGKPVGFGPLEITELNESRAETVDARKADEAQRLLKAATGATLKIALDENGRQFTSDAFAKLLGRHADSGVKTCALLIGGPDGHGADVLGSADIKLSLGSFTLPHGLARVVLIEQLYRAATILTGHPYHRA
ncbi:MAG: 23S rRNA (pseudouridine(1915)-N(3))-methyltransferase RlmH [Hyphomicrobium sp.]|nr:23S rRNA (pseudouridine(1915)-N(3))-methyltransferase RlmH [Hyphomicrobium sp.]